MLTTRIQWKRHVHLHLTIGCSDRVSGNINLVQTFYTGTVCDNISLSFCFIAYPFKQKGQTVTFHSPPKRSGCLIVNSVASCSWLLTTTTNRWESFYSVTNRLGMALFSNELFLHYPSVLLKRGCVLYNRKGRSFFPSLLYKWNNNSVLSHTENVLQFHACSPLCHQFAQSWTTWSLPLFNLCGEAYPFIYRPCNHSTTRCQSLHKAQHILWLPADWALKELLTAFITPFEWRLCQ